MSGFTGAGFGMQAQFWCYIDNEGYIVTQDYGGSHKRIGVNLQKFSQCEKQGNEALAKAEEYYNLLIEHGIKKKELTPEEKFAALQNQMETLTGLVEQQAQLINALTANIPAPEKQRPKAVEPEIIPSESTGENLNAKFVASGGNSQALVSQ